MAEVEFRKVTKIFEGKPAVDALDLVVNDGEFLVLVGPSGCGKSTALRMVAGLETITSGDIVIENQVVNDLAPNERDIAMVFQSYALYPHLSVAKNIAFPLRRLKLTKEQRNEKVASVASTLGLSDYLDRRPGQLSGGQRQRVALARAIVRSPRAFLMDEPLSNLDASLRIQTRSDIVNLQRELATTTIYVTHDQVEAMTMGHRIAVLSGGVLQQVGAPLDLYRRPANTFVAGFLGAPGMNLLSAMIVDGQLRVGAETLTLHSTHRDGPVTIGVRAEELQIDTVGIPAVTEALEILGAEVHVICRLEDGTKVTIRQSTDARRPVGHEPVSLSITASELPLFDALSGVLLEAPAR